MYSFTGRHVQTPEQKEQGWAGYAAHPCIPTHLGSIKPEQLPQMLKTHAELNVEFCSARQKHAAPVERNPEEAQLQQCLGQQQTQSDWWQARMGAAAAQYVIKDVEGDQR